MIELGPLHISLPLVFWEIAALHGVWSRRRIYLLDLRQLRENRRQHINGAMERYGVRTVAESARSMSMYTFAALIGLVGALIDPAPGDAPAGAALVSWALVAMLSGFSFSDYVVRWVARKLERPSA